MNVVQVSAILFIFIVGASAGGFNKLHDENHSNEKNLSIWKDEMSDVMKVCNESFPTPLEFLKKLNETGKFPPEAKKESKCYIYCVLEHLEVMNEKGEVQMDDANELFQKETNPNKDYHDSVRKCVNSQNKNEKDVCEKAYQFVSCVLI